MKIEEFKLMESRIHWKGNYIIKIDFDPLDFNNKTVTVNRETIQHRNNSNMKIEEFIYDNCGTCFKLTKHLELGILDDEIVNICKMCDC